MTENFNLTFDRIEDDCNLSSYGKAICHVDETNELRCFDLHLFEELFRLKGQRFTVVIETKPGTSTIKVEPQIKK